METQENKISMTVIKPYGKKPVMYCGYLDDGSNIDVYSERWSDWCSNKISQLFKHIYTDDKSSVGFITGYVLKPDGVQQLNNKTGDCIFYDNVKVLSRCCENVKKVYALLLDYDDDRNKLEQIGLQRGLSPIEASNLLKSMNLSHWIYTSYSYGITEKNGIKYEGGANKFRAIIPLKHPVDIEDVTSRKHQLRKLFKVDDTASFSASQGFYLPSCPLKPLKQPVQITHDADLFDLMSVSKPVEVERVVTKFSSTASDWFSVTRERLVQSTVLVKGSRNQQLKDLAIALRMYHAEQAEIQDALESVLLTIPQPERQQHYAKPRDLAKWVTEKITNLHAELKSTFNVDFIPLEQAQGKITDALDTGNDCLINVTAGAGKSRAAALWASSQRGKNIAFFNATNAFQEETQQVVSGQFKSGNQNAESRWKGGFDKSSIIIGRAALCDFPAQIEALNKQAKETGESGLISNYCMNDCLYAGGDGCKYHAQYQNTGRIRIYTHANMFSAKGLWDDFTPDIAIIDEDLFGAAHRVASYSYDDAVAIRDKIIAIGKQYQKDYKGAVGLLLMNLVRADIRTATDLSTWVAQNNAAITEAVAEKIQMQTDGVQFRYESILTKLSQVMSGLKTWEIYTKKGILYYTYIKPIKMPEHTRVIVLDATADLYITSKIIGRELAEYRVDIEKSQYTKVTQIYNTGASKNKKNDKRYNAARFAYLKRRQESGAKIISNKDEVQVHGFGELWFGKCRGFNNYEAVPELHIAAGYNLPPSAIENAARAIYWDIDNLSFDMGKVKTTTRGTVVSEYRYLDENVAKVERYLAVAELEQAIHRGRLIRRSESTPLHVYIHTNKPVNVTVDETVKWQDLYDCKEAEQQASNIKKRERLREGFVQIIQNAIDKDGELIWKKGNLLTRGVTERQWALASDINILKNWGFDVKEREEYSVTGKRWITVVVVTRKITTASLK